MMGGIVACHTPSCIFKVFIDKCMHNLMGVNKIAEYSSKSTIMKVFEEEHGKVDIEKNLVKAL